MTKTEDIIKALRVAADVFTQDKWEAVADDVLRPAADRLEQLEQNALSMAKVTEELLDAARFYANEEHWKQEVREEPCGCCTSFEGFEAQNDEGDKARHALTAYEAAIMDRGM